MVDPGDTFDHGEYGPVEVLAVRTVMDRVISDGALTKTRVVDFDAAYDPTGEDAPRSTAVETEPLDAFLANVTARD